MKTVQKMMLVMVVLFASHAFAQHKTQVYAVITKASWCPTCVKNEPRIMSEVLPKVDANRVTILVNDLSNKGTKSTSTEKLKESGLSQLKLKTTGIITLVDPSTQKVISSISVSESSQQILTAFQKALN